MDVHQFRVKLPFEPTLKALHTKVGTSQPHRRSRGSEGIAGATTRIPTKFAQSAGLLFDPAVTHILHKDVLKYHIAD